MRADSLVLPRRGHVRLHFIERERIAVCISRGVVIAGTQFTALSHTVYMFLVNLSFY